MEHLTLSQLSDLADNDTVEVHFSNYNRVINLIKEIRILTGCGLKDAVDIVRDRTLTLTVTGPVGVMKVLAMVNNLNIAFAHRHDDGYGSEYATLTVNFTMFNDKRVFHA